MKIQSLAVAGFLSLLLSLGAGAVPYTGGVALPATQTIDFESVSPNVAAGTISGVTFTNWFSSPFTGLGVADFGSPGFLGNHNRFTSFPVAGITSSFSFSGPVSSASFSIAVASSNATIQALLGGGLVESFVMPATNFTPLTFVGFTGITFDSIRIITTNNAGGTDVYIDNLGFNLTVAPELDAHSASLPLIFSLVLLLSLRSSARRHGASGA